MYTVRKLRLLIILLITSLVFTCCHKSAINQAKLVEKILDTIPATLIPVTYPVSDLIHGYYVALPSTYKTSPSTYPLLIFMHGGGQFGNGSNDLPLLLNEGITQLLDEKKFPPLFTVNGNHFSFVVIAPQCIEFAGPADIHKLVAYAKKTYRIDDSRIYLSGLSLGGRMSCNYAAEYPNEIAALVPMSGVSENDSLMPQKSTSIAASNLPVWIFHNHEDGVIPVLDAIRFDSLLSARQPAIPPQLTLFNPAGLANHDSWTRATDPGFHVHEHNIYEWMLQFKR